MISALAYSLPITKESIQLQVAKALLNPGEEFVYWADELRIASRLQPRPGDTPTIVGVGVTPKRILLMPISGDQHSVRSIDLSEILLVCEETRVDHGALRRTVLIERENGSPIRLVASGNSEQSHRLVELVRTLEQRLHPETCVVFQRRVFC